MGIPLYMDYCVGPIYLIFYFSGKLEIANQKKWLHGALHIKHMRLINDKDTQTAQNAHVSSNSRRSAK